ncbi:hypothetical protein OAL42_02260 [Akkermansiaceae bacterium]|nr:hypothetical protein [Akkermansiaceae bacterium]
MKSFTPLLAFIFLIGCDGEKSNVAASESPLKEAASESPLKEAASENNPPEAVSVNPNLRYEGFTDT